MCLCGSETEEQEVSMVSVGSPADGFFFSFLFFPTLAFSILVERFWGMFSL